MVLSLKHHEKIKAFIKKERHCAFQEYEDVLERLRNNVGDSRYYEWALSAYHYLEAWTYPYSAVVLSDLPVTECIDTILQSVLNHRHISQATSKFQEYLGGLKRDSEATVLEVIMDFSDSLKKETE